jgi:hypothetical protein
MTLNDLESNIEEFAESGYFQLLDPSAKEHAGGILAAFLRESSLAGAHSAEALTGAIIESILLGAMATLNLPLSARQGIPALLSAFFRFVSETGRFPPASQWESVVETLADRYIARFRQDGTIKGDTFKKNYTEVNRNDPCPCGSGKKFKKCCMKLVSG